MYSRKCSAKKEVKRGNYIGNCLKQKYLILFTEENNSKCAKTYMVRYLENKAHFLIFLSHLKRTSGFLFQRSNLIYLFKHTPYTLLYLEQKCNFFKQDYK